VPETEVVIAEAKKYKEGSSAKGPWTVWHITDGNGDKFSTFSSSHFKLACDLVGQRAKITFDENDKGKTITELAGPLDNAEPKLGTGDYVRGQTAPNDKRSMAASVALKAAVDSLSHTIPTTTAAKGAHDIVVPLANSYFLWLLEKGGMSVEPDDIPFGE